MCDSQKNPGECEKMYINSFLLLSNTQTVDPFL